MEGGTDHDLRILDLPAEEEEDREKATSGGTEQSERKDSKSSESDHKLSAEDKREKVAFTIRLQQAENISLCCVMTLNCATGGGRCCQQRKKRCQKSRR